MKKTRIEINITLNKSSKIFNSYNKTQLSEELNNYIYNQCKGMPVKKNININIYHNYSLNNIQKKNIINAIRSNYGIDIKENILKHRNDIIKELILIIIGSIFLIFSNIFNFINMKITSEILSIFAWVVIWEVAYSIMFKDTKIRFQNKRLKKIVESRIEFYQDKTMDN